MEPIREIHRRTPPTIARLLEIWESAVRETHTFLSNGDIAAIRPEVGQGLAQIGQLYGFYNESNVLRGFLGAENGKIEMLFVEASARGMGIGKSLLLFATGQLGCSSLDVNEQNTQGLGFYRHMGFAVTGRSASDSQGRPFPILHLARSTAEKTEETE